MIDIDEGIAMPTDRRGGARRYHFEKMDVGDSMFFGTFNDVVAAQTSAIAWAARHNKDFKVSRRAVDGGYRLWRIK